VGEYGVHWNFFASVAAVALLSHAVRVPPRWLPILAAAVTCVHEVCALAYVQSIFLASVAAIALLSHAVRVPLQWLPSLAAAVTCVHQVCVCAIVCVCCLHPWHVCKSMCALQSTTILTVLAGE
jgi:hypothetical protein